MSLKTNHVITIRNTTADYITFVNTIDKQLEV